MSSIPVCHGDVGSIRGDPFFVDFDEDGGCEAFEGGPLVGKDADLAGAPFELLLDGAFDGIGGDYLNSYFVQFLMLMLVGWPRLTETSMADRRQGEYS